MSVSGEQKYRVFSYFPPGAEELRVFLRSLSGMKARGIDVAVALRDDPYSGAFVAEMPAVEISSANDVLERSGNGRVLLIIGLDKMRSVLEISADSFFAEVEGGAMWGEVRERLKREGLYFPHWQEELNEGASVAQLVMRGDPVRREQAYGRLRESILSLELVTPSGTRLELGSKAVKDVSGYELIPFVMEKGSRCGVVTKVTLKLLPRPERTIYFAISCDGLKAMGLARTIRKVADVEFVEVLRGETDALASRLSPGYRNSEDTALVVGCIVGLEVSVEARLSRLERELRGSGACVHCFSDERGDDVLNIWRIALDEVGGGRGVVRALVKRDSGSAVQRVSENVGVGEGDRVDADTKRLIVERPGSELVTVYLPVSKGLQMYLSRAERVVRVEIIENRDGTVRSTMHEAGTKSGGCFPGVAGKEPSSEREKYPAREHAEDLPGVEDAPGTWGRADRLERGQLGARGSGELGEKVLKCFDPYGIARR